MLSFQKLDVYRCAVDLLSFCATVPGRVPKGFSGLTDQLRRAALSVPLNIAEACAAIIDSLRVLQVLDDGAHARAIELVARIVAMMTKLCR